MKRICQIVTGLFVFLLFARPVWCNENAETDSSEMEITVTACWIECPFHCVLKDLERVPNTKIYTVPDVMRRFQDFPVSLEVIDIDHKQVLDEILTPIGLQYSFRDGFVLISKQQGSTSKSEGMNHEHFSQAWTALHELQPQDKTQEDKPAKGSRKRNGWAYVSGRVFDLDDSSELTNSKVIHRWLSMRYKIGITTRSIDNSKTSVSTNALYAIIPVVERISEQAAARDGLVSLVSRP